MGRAIGRNLNNVIEVDNISPIWLAFELPADFIDIDLYGLYVSARTLVADDTDITDRLHFARYTIARNIRLDVTDNTSSLQDQFQEMSANKLWEKIAYGYFSADICHEFKTPFRLPSGALYTVAVDFGFSSVGLANSDLFRFCIHGDFSTEQRPKLHSGAALPEQQKP